MDQVLPSSASLVIFLLLLTTLLSAADSALVACGSIVGVDVVGKYIDPDIDKTRVSRYAMVGVSALVALAAMSPLNTLDWVMLNAPIGAVLSVPILVYLYFPDVPDDTYTTVALVVGSLVAFPIYIYGTLEGNNSLRLAGLIGALLFSAMLVFVVPSVQQSTNVSSAD